jgi:hypothetical protein
MIEQAILPDHPSAERVIPCGFFKLIADDREHFESALKKIMDGIGEYFSHRDKKAFEDKSFVLYECKVCNPPPKEPELKDNHATGLPFQTKRSGKNPL